MVFTDNCNLEISAGCSN